jgi:tetratricopeptide (TPR) repeat protein
LLTFAFSQIRAQEDPLRQHYAAAGAFLARGDQQLAAEEYRAFLAVALHRVANAEAQISETARSGELFVQALELDKSEPGLLNDYAALRFDQGQLSDAETLLNSALEIDPNDARAHLLLGRVYFNAEKYPAAKRHFEFVFSHGDAREVWFLLGVTDLKLQQLPAAQELFAKVLQMLGDKAATHFRIGVAYNTGDYPDQAVVEFKKAIASDPRALDQHYYLGLAYLGHNPDAGFAKAEPEFRAEITLTPNDFRSHYMLGYIAAKQRRMKEAQEELTRAHMLKPEDLGALMQLAELYSDSGRDSDAEPCLRQVISLAGTGSTVTNDIVRAHYMLGRILQRLGREEEAKKEIATSEDLRLRLHAASGGASKPENGPDIKLASEETPRKPVSPQERARAEAFVREMSSPIAESFYNLGAIAANRQECPACFSYFQRAAEWNAALQGLDRNLGRAAFLCKQYAAAVAPLSRYLEQHAEDVTVRSELGLSLFHTQNYERVVEVLQPIQSSLSSNPELSSAYSMALERSSKSQIH